MDLETIRRCREDPCVFSEVLTGQPLWPWQAEVARHPARYRCLLIGRRAGKSRLLALLATWTAFRRPGTSVLLVSAQERASLRVLLDIAGLCHSSALVGSIVSDQKTTIRLSNGSSIESVPASSGAIRGAAADLLVIDEAAFIKPYIWEAAMPTVADRVRSGARVILATTPWPVPDSWYKPFHDRGMNGDPNVKSWHLPSTVNPNIDDEALADLRAGLTADAYAREVECQWTTDQGSYFSRRRSRWRSPTT